jgi:hypothetical protein
VQYRFVQRSGHHYRRQQTFNGAAKTIKSITKPSAGGPVTWQTRVGITDTISLLIKSTDGATFLKLFPKP